MQKFKYKGQNYLLRNTKGQNGNAQVQNGGRLKEQILNNGDHMLLNSFLNTAVNVNYCNSFAQSRKKRGKYIKVVFLGKLH